MSSVTIIQGAKSQSCSPEPGTTLLELLWQEGYSVQAPCGGSGSCGKCLVTMEAAGERRQVLACQTVIEGDCRVILPEDNEIRETTRHSASETSANLGMAVDLGTTTLAAELIDLKSGHVLASTSARNQQAPYGADVISRIQYTMTHPGGLEQLSGIIRKQIAAMAGELCAIAGADMGQLRHVAIAGNTIMQHIYAGLDPASIAAYPFAPKTLFDCSETADIQLDAFSVHLSPCVAGYVGGDIVAGLYASDYSGKTGSSLFLDIGTNGEMALLSGGTLLTCSVASGPAFEGAEISCGMLYGTGAVCAVRRQGRLLKFETAGGGTPKGLCGSGIIDLLSALLELGVVDETGRFLPPEEAPSIFGGILDTDENGNGILYLTADRQVYFTQGDVRKLQLAKAAVGAGIEVLLQAAGISAEELDELCIAGSFGSSLRPESAMGIGMIPTLPREKLRILGNTSLKGAALALTDPEAASAMAALQKRCGYKELSGSAQFSEAFIDHMSFEQED